MHKSASEHPPAMGDFIFTNAKIDLVTALHRLPGLRAMLLRTISATIRKEASLPALDDAASRSSSWMMAW